MNPSAERGSFVLLKKKSARQRNLLCVSAIPTCIFAFAWVSLRNALAFSAFCPCCVSFVGLRAALARLSSLETLSQANACRCCCCCESLQVPRRVARLLSIETEHTHLENITDPKKKSAAHCRKVRPMFLAGDSNALSIVYPRSKKKNYDRYLR